MYTAFDITSITEIPALLGTFAASVGFDVDNTNPNQPLVSNPTFSDAAQFRAIASINGTNNQNHNLSWELVGGGVNRAARLRSPKLSGTTNNPTVPTPTKLHCFGQLAPEPYLAAVVEYGFNLYRHIYLGQLESIGDYAGGEVVSASQGPLSSNGGSIGYRDDQSVKYLFEARSAAWATENCGAVHIVHVDNPTPWREFFGPQSTTPFDEFTSSQIVGGFGDDINDGYLARGRSPFANVNPLSPINLYAAKPITADTAFVPVGRPAGVRLVHMQDLTPAQQIEIGNEIWHVFPAAAKRSETTMPSGGGGWRQYETSYYVGYAYLEGPA